MTYNVCCNINTTSNTPGVVLLQSGRVWDVELDTVVEFPRQLFVYRGQTEVKVISPITQTAHASLRAWSLVNGGRLTV